MPIKKNSNYVKISAENFREEKHRLELLLNDYSLSSISRRLSKTLVKEIYNQFTTASQNIIKLQDLYLSSIVKIPETLWKRIRGII